MKKLIMMVLSAALLLTGCGGSDSSTTDNSMKQVTEQPQANKSDTYKEQEIKMPDTAEVFQASIDAEGIPRILTFTTNDTDKNYAAYQQFSYKSAAWDQGPFAYDQVFAKNKIAVLQDATPVENGTFFAAQNKGLEDKKSSEYVIWKISDGKADKLVTLSTKQYKDMQVLPDGNLSILSYDGMLTIYDASTGKKVSTYKKGVCLQQVVDDALYVVPNTYDKIQTLDPKTFEVIEEYSNNLTNYGLSLCADTDGNTYCVTENGIYQLDEKTTTLKEIISKDQFSIQALSNSTEQSISGFGIQNGAFYVLYKLSGDNSRVYQLYQYMKS